MAESILRKVGAGRFNAYSAGSQPTKGEVHPLALELLASHGMPTDRLRSKGWEEFATPSSPPLDFVFTVCDNTAGEVCPVWPGKPMTAHWGVPDPASATGTEDEGRKAFLQSCQMLLNRIRAFTSLPFAKLDRLALQRSVVDIGRTNT